MIVDDMHHNYPELLKDMHWNESVPITLPYTEETQHYRKEEPKGSAEQREEDDNNYQVTIVKRIACRSVWRARITNFQIGGEHSSQ